MTEKKCMLCGYNFEATSNFDKLCPTCREEKRLERNEKEKLRLREKRQQKEKCEEKSHIGISEHDLTETEIEKLRKLYLYLEEIEPDQKTRFRQLKLALEHLKFNGNHPESQYLQKDLYECPFCLEFGIEEDTEERRPTTEQIFKTNIEFENWIGTLRKKIKEHVENVRIRK